MLSITSNRTPYLYVNYWNKITFIIFTELIQYLLFPNLQNGRTHNFQREETNAVEEGKAFATEETH